MQLCEVGLPPVCDEKANIEIVIFKTENDSPDVSEEGNADNTDNFEESSLTIERLQASTLRPSREAKTKASENFHQLLAKQAKKKTIVKPKSERKALRLSRKLTEDDEELMREHAEMKCEFCFEDISSWLNAKQHYRKHNMNGFIRCCGRKIESPGDMKDHVMWHQDPNVFSCMTCGKALLTRENMINHEATHIPDEFRQYPCSICFKKFPNEFALTNHSRHHRKDNLDASIPCPHCPDKLYKVPAQLKAHINNCHRNESATYMCHVCSKVLKNPSSLKEHLSIHTRTNPPIECKICGHFLVGKSRYQRHMSKHKSAEKGPYPCPMCQRLCPHKEALTSHINFVHTKNRFKCDVCGKEFKHKQSLREHGAQHTGADMYRCPFCTRTFKSNANMHSHKKKMHPEDYALLPPPSYLMRPENNSSSTQDEQ